MIDFQKITVNDQPFKSIKEKVEDMEANKRRDERDLDQAIEDKKKMEERYEAGAKAREVIQRAAIETQARLEDHISNLVTLAQEAVFTRPYEFGMHFVERRGRTECDLYLIKSGEQIDDPIRSVGGGPCDVASFALRCAFWSLKRTRPVMIFDEPFRFVNDDPGEVRELQAKCAEMTKEVAKELKLQMIIVTTLPEFLAVANNIIRVHQEDDVSKITEV